MCKYENSNFICCESNELKSRLEKCVESHLKAGKCVIVDATNATKSHRKKYITMAQKIIERSIYVMCVYTP